jgi:enhancing lycopene biosynthesis protein 2
MLLWIAVFLAGCAVLDTTCLSVEHVTSLDIQTSAAAGLASVAQQSSLIKHHSAAQICRADLQRPALLTYTQMRPSTSFLDILA